MGSAWKVAYADFVTAMMAFFLLLWVLNMVPPETRAGLAAYFSGERNFDSSSTSPVSNNPFIQNTDKIDTRDLKINEVEKSHYAIAQKIKQMLMADAVPQSSSGISADDVGVQLRVNSDVLFKPGAVDFLAGSEGLQSLSGGARPCRRQRGPAALRLGLGTLGRARGGCAALSGRPRRQAHPPARRGLR